MSNIIGPENLALHWLGLPRRFFADKVEGALYDIWFATYLSEPVFDSPGPRSTVDEVFHFDSNGAKQRKAEANSYE